MKAHTASRIEKIQSKQRWECGNGESACVAHCLWWRTLTSVIIFPLVLFLSRWLALFCFCCSTRSLVVRYSRANSLRILLKRWMLTSRTAYTGWPRNNRKAWNLQTQDKKNVPEIEFLSCKQMLKAKNDWQFQRERSDPRRPVDYSPMHNLQNDDSLCAVFKEVGHFLLQRRFHLVFRDDLKVIPWCFAPSLHLGQIVLKLIKVHLTRASQAKLARDSF